MINSASVHSLQEQLPRDALYDILFAGEMNYDTDATVDEAQLGLSGLTRHVRIAPTPPAQLVPQLERIPAIVHDVLFEHDLEAADSYGSSALFGFVEFDQVIGAEPNRMFVTKAVSVALTRWEHVCYRQNMGTLLSSKDNHARWLVIETAAAAMEIASLPDLREHTSLNERVITKLLTSWGPGFAREWFNGTIINKWALGTGLSPDEASNLTDAFTPAVLRSFISNNTNDPLGACKRTKHNLDTTLSVESIAAFMDWPLEDVIITFQPNLLKKLAIGNGADPMKPLRSIKENVALLADTERVAAHLGWSAEEVRETFTQGELRLVGIKNLKDPLGRLKRVADHLENTLTDEKIAEALGWTTTAVKATFSAGMKKHFAFSNADNPLKACRNWVVGNNAWRPAPLVKM